MQGILYEETSVWLFLLVTLVMGGWTAWMTGKAIAKTWRPYWQLVCYLLILGVAVRFIHYALFHGTFLAPQYYVVDTIILIVIGSLSFRYTRTTQMTTQYSWLYERTGPISWQEKPKIASNG